MLCCAVLCCAVLLWVLLCLSSSFLPLSCMFTFFLTSFPYVATPSSSWKSVHLLSTTSAPLSHVPSPFCSLPLSSAPIPGAHVRVHLSLVSTFGAVCTRTPSFVHYSPETSSKTLSASSADPLYLCRSATCPAFALGFLSEAPSSSSMHDFSESLQSTRCVILADSLYTKPLWSGLVHFS